VEWIYQEDDAELQCPDEPPSLEIIQELTGYVRIGDLQGLNQYLTQLIRHRPEYSYFAQRIMTLAGGFDMAEIKKLLHSASEELTGNDQSI